MYYKIKYSWLIGLFLICGGLFAETIPYVRSLRDTGPLPEVNPLQLEIGESYLKLTETDSLEVFFRDDRDVMAIRDKRNGYVWKTGLDIPFSRDLDDLIDQGADPHSLPPKEDRLNTTYTGLANSLVSIEYYNDANNLKRVGSASYRDSRSTLKVLSQDPFLAELDVAFDDVDIHFLLQIELLDQQLILSLPMEKLEGEDLDRLFCINLAPFFGASGGKELYWDDQEEEFQISRDKESPTGYGVIPDGSGALVRFVDNSSRLSQYVGKIYGSDLSQYGLMTDYDDFSVEPKQSSLPLFGMVHGQRQNAFAGYASKAPEYLEIVSIPEEHITYYSQTYPRFIYNHLYYQIYNKNGDGYYRTLEQGNQFDFQFRYHFLQGEEADYPGIASTYRRFLEETDRLPAPMEKEENIPLRIDFMMADVRDNIVGQAHEVTTTIEDVQWIIKDLQSAGIANMTAGLIGYARGGTVFSKPGKVQLLRELGSRRDFRNTLEELTAQGVDISFSKDYSMIAEGQALPWGNALRGVSGWYMTRRTFLANAPVNDFYYLRPKRSMQWLEEENLKMQRLGASSHSIAGIPSLLLSDYSDRKIHTATDSMNLYQERLAALHENTELNLYQPNPYLWKYTDRYLHIPVFSTQYLMETDTVPLLQMVLQGRMPLFSRYANYSFYGNQDILRMIDYNVYPSFLLTMESPHLLLATHSAENYSSQYAIYKERILEVYGRVNRALREVSGARWTDRQVLSDGVILNRYDNGVAILINYTRNSFSYKGTEILPGRTAVLKDLED